MINRTFRVFLAMAVLVAMLAACAKQGMPSGGPKDETPPQVLRCRPDNSMLGFAGKDFYIEFDEYVVVKDAENNIIVSPPMAVKPEYRTKGRGIQVHINDTLKANTTYLFQFKEAIADYNEGNLLPSFEYVFSTGDYIDSMTISGRVIDALTLQPSEEKVSVWLYTVDDWHRFMASFADTSVAVPSPTYVTRCDKKGKYAFNNIKPGDYFPMAVVDEDKNLKVGNSEQVAFMMNPVAACVKPQRPATADSSKTDSVATDKSINSLITKSESPIVTKSENLILLFIPQTAVQRITSAEFKSQGKAAVTSLLPMKAPSVDGCAEELVWNLNATRDTMTIWSMREKCDSMVVIVSDESGLQDTLKMRFRKKKGPQAPTTNSGMRVSTKTLPYYDTLGLLFSTPVDTMRCGKDSLISVMSLADSTLMPVTFVVDSTLLRVNLLQRVGDSIAPVAFAQGGKYKVAIPKGFFVDIYGHPSDSLDVTITVSKAEEFGNLKLKMESSTGDTLLLVQLLDEKGKVLQTRRARAGEVVAFPDLKPAKYRVRTVVDGNGNGEWNTGDIRRQLQPEKVVYFNKTLDIRANWDFEEIFVVQ